MTKPHVLSETAAVLNLLATMEGPHLADMPAASAREVYHLLGDMFDEPVDPSIRKVDFNGPTCPLRAYFPGASVAGPVIVYAHGGGWVIGDLQTHDALCALIAASTGLRVVAIDYRLAPEHPYPAAHQDCLAAAEFVAASPAQLEAPVTAIAVAGDSAGGNLAFHLAATLGRRVVAGQLLIYPMLDCTSPEAGSYAEFSEGFLLDRPLLDRFIRDYLPDGRDAGNCDVSPLLHPLPGNLPATVILTAALDPLRDQGRNLAAGLAAQGVETHLFEAGGLIHGMATMRKSLPGGDRAIRRATACFAETVRAEICRREETN